MNSLVWLIQRKRLEELLDGKEYNRIFDAGALRLITGHSPDRRRVYVKLAFPFDGEGDHQHCICVRFTFFSTNVSNQHTRNLSGNMRMWIYSKLLLAISMTQHFRME